MALAAFGVIIKLDAEVRLQIERGLFANEEDPFSVIHCLFRVVTFRGTLCALQRPDP